LPDRKSGRVTVIRPLHGAPWIVADAPASEAATPLFRNVTWITFAGLNLSYPHSIKTPCTPIRRRKQ
jgi:hypothetical protein